MKYFSFYRFWKFRDLGACGRWKSLCNFGYFGDFECLEFLETGKLEDIWKLGYFGDLGISEGLKDWRLLEDLRQTWDICKIMVDMVDMGYLGYSVLWETSVEKVDPALKVYL